MRPGIMLYFDLLRPIKKLSDEDKGKLLVAMLEYGQDGVVPEFEGALDMAWEFVKPKLDKDAETYELSCEQREYANFCKSRKKLGLPKIPIEQWKAATENERQQWVTEDNELLRADTEPLRAGNFGAFRNPTTTTTTTPTTTTTTTPTTTTTTTTTAEVTVGTSTTSESNSDLTQVDGVVEDPFEVFWKEYPRKVGKQDARKAFASAAKKVSLEKMLGALEKQKKAPQWVKDKGQFIPHPSTWLNQERWDDEMEVKANGYGNGAGRDTSFRDLKIGTTL